MLRQRAILAVAILLVLGQADPLWVAERAGAYGFAMAMDSLGRIVVVGPTSGIPEDIAAVRYASDGTLLWDSVYNSPQNGREYAYDVAVDVAGRSYITGFSQIEPRRFMITYCLDSLGQMLWLDRVILPDSGACCGVELALDRTGKLYVAAEVSGNDYDIAAFRYDTSGILDWFSTYDGPVHGSDVPWDIGVDPAGNVYVCGESDGPTGRQDGCVVSWDSAGVFRWAARYDGMPGGHDQLLALTLDSECNVIAAGMLVVGSTNTNVLLTKLDSAGVELWRREWSDPDSSYDHAAAVAVDRNDDIVACGTFAHTNDDRDLLVLKYSSGGDTCWSLTRGIHTFNAEARRIVVDEQNRVFVTGVMYPPDSCGWQTFALSPEGGVLWEETYTQPTAAAGNPDGLILDSSGGIYVGGTKAHNGQAQVLIKYRNPFAAIGETEQPLCGAHPATSVFAGPALHTGTRGVLLDASGRQVLGLQPGYNDIRHLSSGVYFVQRDQNCPATKVVVQQ